MLLPKTQPEKHTMAKNSNFPYAFQFTLKMEGGYSDHPADKGGATNYGITIGTLQSLVKRDKAWVESLGIVLPVTSTTMQRLKMEQAEAIYKREYWDSRDLDTFPKRVATVLFDCHVNHGWTNAVRIAQRGYNATVGVYGVKLMDDGIMGNKTRTALSHESDKLLSCILSARVDFYQSIVESRPNQKVFLKGWLNRVDALRKYLGVA